MSAGDGEIGFLINASWTKNFYNENYIESESPFDTTIDGRVEGRFALDVIFVVEILRPRRVDQETDLAVARAHPVGDAQDAIGDRQSGVSGESVSVSVDLGGSRIITKKNTPITHKTHK